MKAFKIKNEQFKIWLRTWLKKCYAFSKQDLALSIFKANVHVKPIKTMVYF